MKTTLIDGWTDSKGHCHAKVGWDQCDEHDSKIRSYDTHHFYDKQLEAVGDSNLLL